MCGLPRLVCRQNRHDVGPVLSNPSRPISTDAARVPVQKGNGKGMMDATQRLHNLGQNLWLGWHNPVLKPTAATGTAGQGAWPPASIGKQIGMEEEDDGTLKEDDTVNRNEGC